MSAFVESLRPRRVVGLDLAELVPGASGRIGGVTLDSRLVAQGDLYVALGGLTTHGARFAADAVARGAVAILTDAEGLAFAEACGVPVAVADDPRVAMAGIAASVYGHPADSLEVYGVTGTNGKTSTTFLVEAALAAIGRRVATIGTIGFRLDGNSLETARTTVTTPESPDLQALLGVMVERGADAVAMEVSSHALVLHRTDAIDFGVAAFTMLGQDHLDFHSTMEDYFAAKCRLFLGGACRVAVVNIDDPWGQRLAEMVRAAGSARLVTVSMRQEADFRVTSWRAREDGGSVVTMAHPGGETEFAVSMLGYFNVSNALTALAMVGAAGHDVATAASGIRSAQVPGRMQRVDLGPDAPRVIVDFAHTPQAIEAALAALPETGRRIAVVGAGGDRDATKRGPMGAAAARGANIVIVTDDNPRWEDPATIRAVLEGAQAALVDAGRDPARALDGGDRRAAVARALAAAEPGDWVILLGKGHERGQELRGVVTPFDDVSVVAECWRQKG